MSLDLTSIVHQHHPAYNTDLPVMVFRPKDAKKAQAVIDEIKKLSEEDKLNSDNFQDLMNSIPCSLVGLLRKDKKIVNGYGEVVDEVQNLDRFSLHAQWQDILYSGIPRS